MKNFALIGVGGYVAPKHLEAIQATGNNLIAALDKFDSVGILDRYFPDADFFVEFERFDRHLEKLKYEQNTRLNYVSICTPNHLHDSHIRMALRRGAHAICEKPLVLNPWNIDALEHIQKESGKNIYTILQLRLHPAIAALKKKIDEGPADTVYDIDLTYITSRGNWYYTSWKGDMSRSGGIATNIGIHFYDMLSWIFGAVKQNTVHLHQHDRAAGYLEFDRARVRWFLSIDYDTLPPEIKEKGQRTYRSMSISGTALEFSDGFTDLHTESYRQILAGNGYGLHDARAAVAIVHSIRNATPVGLKGDHHPYAGKATTIHPYKRKQ